uniref:Uncharacterized protein n=1 Tax=Arundo donax TaxID=35708 RepID=A0A0A9AU06_ARUDO
MQKPPPWK